MNKEKKGETEKTAGEDTVNLKLPRQVLEFAEFYAELNGVERDDLLTKIVVARMKEIKQQLKALPHMQISELF